MSLAAVPAKPRPDPAAAEVYRCRDVLGILIVVIDGRAWFLRTDHGETAWLMRREWPHGLMGLEPASADLRALGVEA